MTQLANAGDGEARVQEYGNIVNKFKISPNLPARIVVARDTRPSGEDLIHAVKDGCYAAGTKEDDTKDLGILTTPQLHYVVRCLNTAEFPDAYGEPTEKGYYTKISEAFKIAMKFKKSTGMVVVDCANGVGGPKFAELMKRLPSAVEGGIDIKLINADVSQAEMLNKGVSKIVLAPLPKADSCSVAPTTSRLLNVHQLDTSQALVLAMPPSMVTRIG